ARSSGDAGLRNCWYVGGEFGGTGAVATGRESTAMQHRAPKVVTREIRMNGSSGTPVPGRTGTREGQRLARVDGHWGRVARLDPERIAERAPEAVEADRHDVTVLEPHPVAEAER